MDLSTVELPKRYNYIACFLTLECNLSCGYCINLFGAKQGHRKSVMPAGDWISGLNRLAAAHDLPVTLQGGEPSLHPGFIHIINNIKKELSIDILTNLLFDVDEFIKMVDPARLRRNAPYPNIRVSYHPPCMDLGELIKKVLKMQDAGFSVGIFSILHPGFKKEISEAQRRCLDLGIDFRTKELLGKLGNKLYGTYLYPEAIHREKRKRCLCRTSELIIGSDGTVFRCHRDLYAHLRPIGSILDEDFRIEDKFRECDQFGDCNPCDIKIKTDRFQVYNHTSVEIKAIIG